MPLLYDLGIGAYHSGIRAAAPFKVKARQWVEGRQGLWERLEAKAPALQGCLWMHCASVGEFEQGRPVLEAIKRERPEFPVLLTFFSPSGYEARKDLGSARPGSLVTHVDYLPPDGAGNARRLVALVNPRAAAFVKYEFWYHHLHALKRAGVPTFLVSAIFREQQPFFKWYGGAWHSMLRCYTHIFTQDRRSFDLLKKERLNHVTLSGDTRFDRVAEIARANDDLPVAAAMTGGAPVLVCGSTWPADDAVITKAFYQTGEPLRVIVAPHELHAEQLRMIERDYPKPLITWSEAEAAAHMGTWAHEHMSTLLVDRMGLLSRLYKYADLCYIGGGFTDGIHSILEAAAWGKPVIFGPRHGKFAEARGLIAAGGAWSISSAEELMVLLRRLFSDRALLATAGGNAARYVNERVGATRIVAEHMLAVL